MIMLLVAWSHDYAPGSVVTHSPLSLQIDSFITLDILNFGSSTHDERVL